ncbi:MAG TPA: hypothetical protein VHY35_10595 [Stellaceae bacterium]|jgi:hypothetical protein|nr:hypothetical protein [Stellaceae bacterium]
MPDHSEDDGRDLAALKVEVRSLREETALNRTRYHQLATDIAPLILGESMVNRHELELRELRSLVDRGRGVWTAISIMGAVVAAMAAGMWAVLDRVLSAAGHG